MLIYLLIILCFYYLGKKYRILMTFHHTDIIKRNKIISERIEKKKKLKSNIGNPETPFSACIF